MFFRREKPKQLNFEDRLGALREAGFETQPEGSGRVRVQKGGYVAIVSEAAANPPHVGRQGRVIGSEIGYLLSHGFQMFWQTPSGRRDPALATELKALHNFKEDLREALGLMSLYNTSLGTTSDRHMYDRVEERDSGHQPHPWDLTTANKK